MSRALPYVWYPGFFVVALAAFFSLLARDVPPAFAAYLPVTVVGFSILWLETRFRERDDWLPGRADIVADATFMGVVMLALPRLLLALAVIVLAGHLHANFASAWWPHDWPLWAQMIAMVLAVDFVRYWLHRACHYFGPLWRLHEVHHSPDLLYVMNVGRFHPLEKVLHFALDTVPFLLLGVAPEVFAGYFLLYSVNGFFQHSNLRLRYGWLNYVVGSAETHRWHHARDPKVASCNFGNTTIVWDLAFGTWCLPGPVGDIGIMRRDYPKGFLAQMIAPFKRNDGRARRSFVRWSADALVSLSLRWISWMSGRRLARITRDPMRVQRAVLASIVERNRDTPFGRAHAFERIDGYERFSREVPVAEFEALRPSIEAEIDKGVSMLTTEAPIQYVRTSGTTGTPKDIPLTRTHLEALRRIHRESVAFEYRNCPAAFEGGIVAIVSPEFEGVLANGKRYGSASGIVAGETPSVVREKFVVPSEVLAIHESAVKYLLALRLAIAQRDVTYLGAANPTTMLTLIKLYREHRTELIEDVRRGSFFLAERVPADTMASLRKRLRAEPARADALARLHADSSNVRIADVWPDLRLVVTWTCASAGVAVESLRKELAERTRIMELGYLSSEFRGTITLGRRRGSGLPTFDTHFFEFVERDAWDRGDHRFVTLDRISKGRDYYVVVTTPSGLYRYFINDVVRVRGFLHATPLLQFVQKGRGMTNITGEKLSEAQVLQAVRDALARMQRTASFVMMLADEQACRYRLYVEADAGPPREASTLADAVDLRLRELNVEYRAKRESERLGPVHACWLAAGTGERYKRHCVDRGQREGQFKALSLDYRRHFAFDLDACALEA